MNIKPMQNNQNPTFEKAYLVQVNKNAFKSQKFNHANKTFIDTSNKYFGELPGWLSTITCMLGFGKKTNKTLSFLEFPQHQYQSIQKYCEKTGISSKHLEAVLGEKRLGPLNEDYHSFFVLTKETKDKAFDFLSNFKPMDIMREVMSDVERSSEKNISYSNLSLRQKAKTINKFMDSIEQPAKTYKVEALSDLPAVFKEMEV